MLVNVAPQCDQARLIENFCRDRAFLRAITANIESLGRRVGKDVVISVVKVREFNPGPNSYREKRWNERQILLRDFFRWEGSWTRESTVEVNHRKRRLRGKYAAFSDDFVSLGLNRRRMRFW